MFEGYNFPKQQLSSRAKDVSWRKSCVNWGADRNVMAFSPVRNTVKHMKINYDLLNGKLHMDDLQLIINPDNTEAKFVPKQIQHYAIMKSKLDVLVGEESKRTFEYRVVVTNPDSISEIEENKKAALMQELQVAIQDTSSTKEEFDAELNKIQDKFNYEWQDFREIAANELLRHYVIEYNIPYIFNQGFRDALAVGEEIYQCDIVGGEPVIEKLNPTQVRIYRSGYSNKIEDADIVVIEDYWSPGKIYDHFHEILSKKDIEYIENIRYGNGGESKENEDYRLGFTPIDESSNVTIGDLFPSQVNEHNIMPYDFDGNIRVTKVYWKSRRQVKFVRYFDEVTGEELYNIYPEDYIPNKDKGEKCYNHWINEAWEGTKIGDKIYVNMRPRPIQYNTVDNPSKCHFGIVGSIYNLNDDKPFSMVDIMKPYNYLYDVVYDRLNRLIARNYGKVIRLDFAKVPNKWDVDKWMYMLKTYGVAVEDSFKEGNHGAATGKLAGGLNNATTGAIDLELGQSIQQNIALLEHIQEEMGTIAGISRQREGQISNRETVGGVERATLQSSHITEWLFYTHDDLKKRALECFLDTAKIALRGKTKKFQYIMSDSSRRILTLDGNNFAESSYGICVDNSNTTQEFMNNLPMLIQAGIQNQALSFSTVMKIYNSNSRAEKQRMIEQDEKNMREMQQQQQQQQLQVQQEIEQAKLQQAQAQMEQQAAMNTENNETKIYVAQIQAQSRALPQSEPLNEDNERLNEQIREFDQRLSLDKQKLELEKDKVNINARLKEKQINKQTRNNTK